MRRIGNQNLLARIPLRWIRSGSASPLPARADPPWLDGLLARGYQLYCGFDADSPGDAAAARMLALIPQSAACGRPPTTGTTRYLQPLAAP